MPGPPNSAMEEERASSFYELRDDMPKADADAAAASRSRSARRSGRRGSMSRASRATTVYNEQDANAMILRANAPPNYSGGFDGACITAL